MSAPEPVPIAGQPWVERSWRRDIVVAIVTVFTGLFLAWLLEQIPQQEALKRAVTRTLMPLLTPLHERRDNLTISIFTVDDLDIAPEHFAEHWPLRLGFLAGMVEDILEKSPRVLFIDLLLKKDSTKEDIEALRNVICNASGKTSVYVAWLGSDDLQSPAEKAIFRPQNSSEKNVEKPGCAIAVNTRITSDKLDNLQWEYPVQIKAEKNDPSPKQSVALKIFCDLQKLKCPNLTHHSPPMALIWPALAAKTNVDTMIVLERPGANLGYKKTCRSLIPLREAVPGVTLLEKWVSDENSDVNLLPCPYHPVIPLRAIRGNGFTGAELDHAIADQIVMLGADISGTGDKIVSPVNGILPGVHVHAMALENLLQFEGKYKQAGRFEILERGIDKKLEFAPLFTRANAFVVLSVLSIVMLLTLWNHYYTEAQQEPIGTSAPPKLGCFRRWLERAGMLALMIPMLVAGWPRGTVTKNPRQLFLSETAFFFINLTLMALIFVAGYWGCMFRQGPLQIVEYVAFPFLAHFMHLGESISNHGYAWFSAIGKPNPWNAWAHASRAAKQDEH